MTPSLVGKQDSLLTTDSVFLANVFQAMDHGKAARELGWRPRPLEGTVRDTLAWFARRGHVGYAQRVQLSPMQVFEWTLVLLTAAVVLTAIAKKIGVPYPCFLALGGTALALIPDAPEFRLNPELTLALFVAPVLTDTAFDTSLRDLKRTWIPVTSLVLIAVGLTTVSVAAVACWLVPELPWAAAITLGAIVAPPDAAAATAVLRQLRLPHRVLVILEGESLLNDASALLVYRIASLSLIDGRAWTSSVVPLFTLGILGSIVAGYSFARVTSIVIPRVKGVSGQIVMQFVATFGVWILAERLGLSPIVTLVVNAITVARSAPQRTPASVRVPSYAVWDTVVFIANVLAFVFIGLQLRPILNDLARSQRLDSLWVAALVLLVVIAVRVAWVVGYAAAARWKYDRYGPGTWIGVRPPPGGASLVVAWCGMRGIVTLAAAYALPESFPYRDLILLCAFCVVVGTLVLQGLTLKPLIDALGLSEESEVDLEVRSTNERLTKLALQLLDGDTSQAAQLLRQELTLGEPTDDEPTHEHLRSRVIVEQRRLLVQLRASGEIGDDAFHEVEARLDIVELSVS